MLHSVVECLKFRIDLLRNCNLKAKFDAAHRLSLIMQKDMP